MEILMKKIITLLGLAILTTGLATAQNQRESFGLGIILGNPSGLSLKIPSGPNSINAIFGYNSYRNGWGNCDGPGPGDRDRCYGDGSIYLGADYIFYNYNLIRVSKGRLPLYYGPGLNATFWDAPPGEDGIRVGFRIAVGLEYQFATAPFDIFFEIAPGINVVPNTSGYVMAGIGTRFFF
jgi:hypothetical protein